MKRTAYTIILAFFFIGGYGQDENYFQHPVDGFSKKKVAYVTLADGTEIQGKIKKFNWKKGNFEEIKLETDGDKSKISAEEIKHMYIPQNLLNKVGNFYAKFDNVNNWDTKSDINMEYIKDGYAYFEAAETRLKKNKTQVLLLQLLNPAFCSKVKIFHDRNAKETAGIGIGGLDVTGGLEKSYWVQKTGEVAYKLKKKEFKDQADEFFGDCADYYDGIKNDLKWKEFEKYIFDYSNSCK